MTRDPWTSLALVAPERLRDALLEVHWSAQFLASAGQTFAEPRDDDSHRAMSWDRGLRSFVGEGFREGYPFRLSLRVEDLTLVLLDRTGQALGSLPLGGVTRDQGYEWLAAGLANYMGAPPPEIARPEYELPPHRVSAGAAFSADIGAELEVISALYGSAAALLTELAESRGDASPVRCWPHHFDIATLLTVAEAAGEEAARTVGVGIAPMGGGYDDWYWYVTPWPYPDAGALPDLEGPGDWHTEGWTAAVLVADAVVAAAPGSRAQLVGDFVSSAVEASTRALGV